MTRTNAAIATLAGLALMLLPACSGSKPSTPVPASTLAYTNPSASGFSLQFDTAATTPGHLVLDLVGPAGTVAQGVSFFLTTDTTKATWSKAAGAYAVNGSTFTLGIAPMALAAKVDSTGADLQVGIYQKSGAATFTASAPLVSVALDLVPGTVTAGSTVTLTATPMKQPVFVDGNGNVQAIIMPIRVGILTAN